MKRSITQDPDILGGKPIIKGTRMSVESIMELISSGLSIQEIVKEYPFLSEQQVKDAVSYATDIVKKEERYIFKNNLSHDLSFGR